MSDINKNSEIETRDRSKTVVKIIEIRSTGAVKTTMQLRLPASFVHLLKIVLTVVQAVLM